ncbi:MAG: OmpA family protein [Paracoccaceae bacterium]
MFGPHRELLQSPSAFDVAFERQRSHVTHMVFARRYLIGSLLCSVAVGGGLALDYLGSVDVGDPLTVQFTRGTELAPGEAAKISAFVAGHVSEPRLMFHVLGHSGQRGESEANLELSQKRAEVVAAFLVDAGLAEAQILSAQGAGSADPLSAEPDESSGALQRRMARAVITPVVRK